MDIADFVSEFERLALDASLYVEGAHNVRMRLSALIGGLEARAMRDDSGAFEALAYALAQVRNGCALAQVRDGK